MASILRAKNAKDLTPEDRQRGKRFQWNAHCGAKARARNLRRMLAETLREQRAGCDWLSTTATLEHAPEPQNDSDAAEARRLAGCE